MSTTGTNKQRRLDPISDDVALKLPTFIQGSKAPVLRGDGLGGFDFVCGKCRNVVVENITVGQLWNLAFRCFSCGTANATPKAPPGTVFPHNIIVMDVVGPLVFSGTAELPRWMVIAGEDAMIQRALETRPTSAAYSGKQPTRPGPARTLGNLGRLAPALVGS
jgi:hypothetical protein